MSVFLSEPLVEVFIPRHGAVMSKINASVTEPREALIPSSETTAVYENMGLYFRRHLLAPPSCMENPVLLFTMYLRCVAIAALAD